MKSSSRWPKWLYRSAALAVMLAALATSATAQLRRAAPSGPRAVGVLELQTSSAGSTIARLVPIAIWDNGKLFDAGLYRARPVPMALDNGVVYEVLRTGESIGFFTVERAARMQASWSGTGKWQPEGQRRAKGELPKADDKVVVPGAPGEDDPERPRLGRNESGQATSKPGDYNRADLPPQGSRDAEPGAPTGADDDPDRPVLKRRPPEPKSTPEAAPPAEPPGDDPDRPVLKRGKPEAEVNKPPDAAAMAAAAEAAVKIERYPAISDASNNETRGYHFDWTADEQQRLQPAMEQLARQQVDFTFARTAAPAASRRTTNAPTTKLSEVSLRAFDLDTDNYAELVLTARFTAAGGQQGSVTVLARLNLENRPAVLFKQVTEDNKLDVTPRLELVDAVDADGDGRAELLFRSVGPGTAHYAIYKVGRTVERLIESAAVAR